MLSDPALRSNYDRAGSEGVLGAATVDSSALFAMIFGRYALSLNSSCTSAPFIARSLLNALSLSL